MKWLLRLTAVLFLLAFASDALGSCLGVRDRLAARRAARHAGAGYFGSFAAGVTATGAGCSGVQTSSHTTTSSSYSYQRTPISPPVVVMPPK